MEFQKERVFTALNANELKIGSRVFIADNIATLKEYVDSERSIATIKHIANDSEEHRFIVQFDSDPNTCAWGFAYLISEPEEKKLKWTDLKIGDMIQNKSSTHLYMVVGMDYRENSKSHILTGACWLDNDDLEEYWEKVE